ncbi:aldehyde dehydrogenase family protein [Noviherbaspirillum saxi]|uniref:Aldehyde dehydrogenase family protein n=1 Tax=Noviherbaspirillum saxi TaxID=2320863 RepID=A0A3A3FLE9_9BURK|nr:aldehyde dehydrogenase family protein [Noviherbaspirillum saxi]RJF92185.1 aldehyde dehydrogenase family protein [Noviherbaspirillum saxi]
MKPFNNFIAGEWVPGARTQQNINPSDTSDVIGEYAQASTAQAFDAVAAAKQASGAWARTSVQEKSDALDFISRELLDRREELGTLLAREEGKTLADGMGEVARAAYIFRFFAGEVLHAGGELIDSVRPNVRVEVTREPVGVVSIITPWNFPIAIPAWKIAPALAFGNAVVLKPAELVPGSAWALAEIISRAGLPAGTFNLVIGKGSEIGPALIESPHVDAITFTGSVATGKRIASQAVGRLAKLQMEMGGKNPQVILDDADLNVAVNVALQSAFFQTGQRCTASSRLIVTDGIHDRFVSALRERMETLRIDHALKAGTDIGPVVDQQQLDQDLRYIEIGKEEGANLVFGGDRLQRDTEGFYLQPALFTETTAEMRINREEIFGPVASVMRVKDYDEAIAVANDTPFGLSAGIATTSLKHADHFKRNSQAGMVMVNLPTAGVDYHVPFGGRKGSSYGPREQGKAAREFYTTVKTSYVG